MGQRAPVQQHGPLTTAFVVWSGLWSAFFFLVRVHEPVTDESHWPDDRQRRPTLPVQPLWQYEPVILVPAVMPAGHTAL